VNLQAQVVHGYSRGVRVYVEIDAPGHMRSLHAGLPQLLTPCYADGKPTGELGPMNPAREAGYGELAALWGNFATLFPDALLHIGGDEVGVDCWKARRGQKWKFGHKCPCQRVT